MSATAEEIFAGKRILVTGGAGVIGTELIQIFLDHGARVLCCDLKPRPAGFDSGVDYIQGDANLLSADLTADFGPEFFFHLAATFERSIETEEFWEESYWHNIRLSHHMMTILKDSRTLQRVVFASSYLIYDPHLYLSTTSPKEPTLLGEANSIYPRNICGGAKLLHELELRFLGEFESFRAKAVSARIFRVYGRGSNDIVSRWVRELVADPQAELQVYCKEGVFDYIYAGEVARGLALLGACDEMGVVNLGRGRSRSIAELIEVLRRRFPKLQTREILSDIPFEAHRADMTRFERLTGWCPTVDLETGVDLLIDHERDRARRATGLQASDSMPWGVLISSAASKVPLIQRMSSALAKSAGGGKVWAGDADQGCVARYFADAFWPMPPLDELDPEILIRFCRENSIGLVVPTRDGELAFYAEHRELLTNSRVYVAIGSVESIRECLDKLAFHDRCRAIGIPTIPTFSSMGELKSAMPDVKRVVVKERHGAGSRTLGINLNHAAALQHAVNLTEPVFQPLVRGVEHSVDLFVNREGEVVEVVPRIRCAVRAGESVITETVKAPELVRRTIKLARSFGLRGHAVIQAFVGEGGQPTFIECNPRVGGASALSMEAGLDSMYWSLLEAGGHRVEPRLGHYRCGLRMVRYFNDRFMTT